MATFFSCVFVIAVMAFVTVKFVETNKNDFGYTYLGAFVLWSIIIAVAQAISFVITLAGMLLFDFVPFIFGHWLFWVIIFVSMLPLVVGRLNKDTK
ncbi:TPA: hypothetical protein ACGIMR_000507 [Salmonella enterica subsp. enterica serovar Javiana]